MKLPPRSNVRRGHSAQTVHVVGIGVVVPAGLAIAEILDCRLTGVDDHRVGGGHHRRNGNLESENRTTSLRAVPANSRIGWAVRRSSAPGSVAEGAPTRHQFRVQDTAAGDGNHSLAGDVRLAAVRSRSSMSQVQQSQRSASDVARADTMSACQLKTGCFNNADLKKPPAGAFPSARL